jgi:hypothetical protein
MRPGHSDARVLIAVALGLAVWWLGAFWPAIVLTTSEVIVRNPWGTRRVPLADITDVRPGYSGLTVTTRPGQSVTAWAVQKSNTAKWSGRQTRADEVAAIITAAATAA